MKINRIVFPVAITILIYYSSCKKADKAAELPIPPMAMTVTEKFFTVPATTTPVVKTIAQSIFRQNEKGKFVEDLVKRIGYPRWDKAMVADQSGVIRTETGEGYSSISYIPFVVPDSNTTSAVLAVGIQSTDTIYNLIYPQSYQQYGFNYVAEGWNAKSIFQLFSEFDYFMFGQTNFLVTDGRIFDYEQTDTLLVTRNLTPPNTESSLITETWVEVCITYTIVLQCPVFYRSNYVTEAEETICTSYYIGSSNTSSGSGPGPFPPGSGGGGGGGGNSSGGPGWPNQPQCPVLPRTISTEIVTPCSPGWIPIPGGGDNGNTTTLSQLLKEWDDRIIIDPTVRPCIENIITQIKGLELGTIAKVIHNLSGSLPGFDWEIAEVASISGQNANADAETNISPNTPVPHSITYLNNATLHSATNISIARTIIHESVHAFLYDYFYYAPNLSQSERDNILGLPYSKMLKQYLRHSNPLQGNTEHNLMANNFRADIAEALKNLCPVLGINLTGNDLDLFCNDMSWGSLQDDDDADSPWRELAPENRARITKRLEIELNNLPGFTGLVYDPTPGSQLSFPVSLTKVGTKACP